MKDTYKGVVSAIVLLVLATILASLIAGIWVSFIAIIWTMLWSTLVIAASGYVGHIKLKGSKDFKKYYLYTYIVLALIWLGYNWILYLIQL